MRMENGSRANKTNARNNLCRHPRVIAAKASGQFVRHDGEHGRAKTNEEVGAQPGRLAMQLPFEPNDSAQNSRHYQAENGGGDDDPHLVAQEAHRILNHMHFGCEPERLNFITGKPWLLRHPARRR